MNLVPGDPVDTQSMSLRFEHASEVQLFDNLGGGDSDLNNANEVLF